MKYTRMGSTGAQVSRLCLGCMSFGQTVAQWGISEEDSLAIVRKAAEAGINFFDTADIYGKGESEEILGRIVRKLGLRRDETVIATKAWGSMGPGPNRVGLSRKHLFEAIDASLKRLGLDYVDLYQIHRFDYLTPIEETIDALDDLVKSGKVLYVGASSMLAYQFSKFLDRQDRKGKARFATMQNHYSLLYREEEREMNPLCEEEGVGLIPWGPLAGGRLSGSREAGTRRAAENLRADHPYAFARPADEAVIEALRSVARERGETTTQVALAWMLTKPAVTAPIVGITKLAQLDDPIRAVDAPPLGAEEIARLEAPYVAQAPVGLFAPKYQTDALNALKYPGLA